MTLGRRMKINHRAVDSLNNSGSFMSHDYGRETASSASVVSMQVSSAVPQTWTRKNGHRRRAAASAYQREQAFCNEKERAPSWILSAVLAAFQNIGTASG